jgi:catechol 2,3-dioxygenase-like lactoylglutathione lyase family enzyme
MPAELDHLVIAVPDLERAVRDLARRTGVEPVRGGSHPGLGTRNALVGLTWAGSSRCYLELLAPDPAQPEVPADATMLQLGTLGRDFAPRVLTWAVRPVDLDATLAAARHAGVPTGRPMAASRRTVSGHQLSWQLAVPRPLGLGGVQPFLIDWQGAAHPGDGLEPVLELVELELHHPDPEEATRRLQVLGVDLPVRQRPTPALRATVATPWGPLVLP